MKNKTKLEIEQEKMSALVKEGESFYKSGIKSADRTIRHYYKKPTMRKVNVGDKEYDIIIPYNVIQTMKNKGKQFTKPKPKRKKSKKTFGKRK